MPKYVDYAEYYDFHHDIQMDVEFYLDYARQCGSPILELACGTGRVLVHLAEAGFEIYGVDLSENMLSACRRKVREKQLADRVHLTLADMSTFDLPRKDFALVYVPVRSFMHLYTQEDQLACLQHTYEHLRPGGIFIVDVYAPDFKLMAQEPDGPFILQREFDLPNGHSVKRRDRFVKNDLENQIGGCLGVGSPRTPGHATIRPGG